ncbi:hypothetical protein PV10_05471 [Exophiala mesophila]|uniref:Uncharacterized protein n=1 Tax=Exophiala mesophila TaxID=212818 RepID=A0A0D1WP83_EXOME|nr:uncharacterized protein PV10_05471 [Exophiala mesophila]KIV90865.1 hypothetical protein PV10_05471 [Exophiala mesophila]
MSMTSYPPFRHLAHAGRKHITAKFCPILVPWAFEQRDLKDKLSASTFRIEDEMKRRNPDILHWKVISSIVKQVPYAVLRNRAKMRFASAFGTALKSQGYHDNGQPRKDAMDASQEPLLPLKGTLEIYLFIKDPLTDPFPDLVAESAGIIQAVKRHQISFRSNDQNNKMGSALNQGPLIRRIQSS